MTNVAALAQLLRSERLTHAKLADGTGVILQLDSLRVLTLNETGMFLIEKLQAGTASKDDLAAALAEEFDVDEPSARADLEGFLDELDGVLADAGA